MDEFQPTESPMNEAALSNNIKPEPRDVDEHPKFLGVKRNLVYIENKTRLDLLVPTSMFASYLHKQIKFHVLAAKRVLSNHIGKKELKVVLKPESINQLTAYVDFDWEK